MRRGWQQEEIFGPVLVILFFSDEADLVAQANDSVYGLACGIWTADYRRAWRIARAIEAGTIWINTYKQLSVATLLAASRKAASAARRASGVRLYQQREGHLLGHGQAGARGRHGTMSGSVGFIGLGVMGEPMCRNLAQKSGRPSLLTGRTRRWSGSPLSG